MRTRSIWIVLALIFSTCAYAGEPLKHSCPTGDWKSKLVIDVIAVGQGDSTFIRTPAGVTMLIDAGEKGHGKADVLPTLKRCYGIKNLDYVVVTHPHSDHFGGMPEVLNEMTVNKAIYDTGDALGGKAYIRYANIAKATGKRKIPELGDKAFAAAPVKIEVLA